MSRLLDIAGQQFGRLTVLRKAESSSAGRKARWLCLCSCGAETTMIGANLRSGNHKSCGCMKREALVEHNTTHGLSSLDLDEYNIWCGMRMRCRNPSNNAYPYYGGRGITICPEWNDFAAFLRDMGKRPSLHHSIDRINNNGNYEPSNCRWATPKEQAANKRPRGSARREAQGASQ